MLQSDLLQLGSIGISTATCALVLNLTYRAGARMQQVDNLEKRMDHLEENKCPHIECPLKMRFDAGSVREQE